MYIRKCMMAPCVIQFSSSVFFPLCSYCYQGSCPRTIPLPHIVVYCSVVIMPGLQQVRLPCPSLSPRVCSNPCLLNKMVSSNHFILCHPLLLPSICPRIRVFSNESALCIRWPKYWSFRFSISPSNEYSRLISSRID